VCTGPQSRTFIAIHPKRIPKTQILVHTIIDYVDKVINFINTSIYSVGCLEITIISDEESDNSTNSHSTTYGVCKSPQSRTCTAIHSKGIPKIEILVHTIIESVYRDSNFIITSIYPVRSPEIATQSIKCVHKSTVSTIYYLHSNTLLKTPNIVHTIIAYVFKLHN
jgi:hypothetical protein